MEWVESWLYCAVTFTGIHFVFLFWKPKPVLRMDLCDIYKCCYGSDEEQTRTAATDAAEQKCHTPMLQQKWKRERDEKEHTDLRGSLHPREGKIESFYYRCNIQVEAYLWKYRAWLPYISRGQNRKKK